MISVQYVPLILLVLTFGLAGSALARLSMPRVRLDDERTPQLYRFSAYGMRIMLPLFTIAVLYFVSICLPLMPVAPGWVRWGFYVCLVVWAVFEFVQTWSIPVHALEGNLLRQLRMPVVFVGGLLVSLFLLLSLPILFQGDSAEVQLHFPGSNEWLVIHGGDHPAVNMYAVSERQSHSLELVRVERGTLGRRLVTDQRSLVLAPIDGRVVTIMEGYADLDQSDYFEDQLGNYLSISIGDGLYVLLGHLLPGSLEVEIGDLVEAGQPVAIASSGRLHLRVQDQPEFVASARTHPFSFLEVRRKRFVTRLMDEARLVRNDVVSSIGE